MSETSDCIVFSDAAIKRGDHIIWQHGTFAIPTGSVTAIVGTNGTGKTTMMRAELGLLPLCHGSLTVLGKPAGEMNKRIGYVPQSYVANVDSNLTAEQSVLLGLTGTRFGIHPITKAQKAKALEAMEFTGIGFVPMPIDALHEKGCATIVEMAAQPFSLVITIRTRY